MASLVSFFSALGLDEKETLVMTSVLTLGVQPASVIAKHTKLDRTTTYRILKSLTEKKLLSQSSRKGTTVFYNEKTSTIKEYLKKEQARLANLEEVFDEIAPELESLTVGSQPVPKISHYEGFDRLPHLFEDVIRRAKEQNLLCIRILGSNTFSQKLEQRELGDVIGNFAQSMTEHNLNADILVAQGTLTREWVTRMSSLEDMATLPAAGGATTIILVGETVFIVSFRDIPLGVRLDQPDIAQTMHFLFDQIGR